MAAFLATVAVSAEATSFTFEFACTDVEGTNYQFYTDFDGVILAHAYPENGRSGSSHVVLAACGSQNITIVSHGDPFDVEDIYGEMYSSETVYSWDEVLVRLRENGFHVTMTTMPENFCLCDPDVLSGAKWPEWPAERENKEN